MFSCFATYSLPTIVLLLKPDQVPKGDRDNQLRTLVALLQVP